MQRSDKKRIIAVTLVIIVLIIIGLANKFYKDYQKGKFTPGIYALPSDAIIFFKGMNFDELYREFSETALWQGLLQNKNIKSLHQQIIILDSLINTSNSLRKSLSKREIIISLHKTAHNKFDILALIQTNNTISFADINSVIKIKQKGKLTTRNFENTEIYDIQITTRESQLAFAFIDGILMISKNPILVEDAIRSCKKNKRFLLSNEKSGIAIDKKENWFINYRNINSLLEIFLSNESKALIKELEELGDLGSYEFDFDEKYFSFRGNISESADNLSFISLFYDQMPQKPDIQKIISQRTAILMAFYIRDFENYYKKYIERLKARGKWDEFRNRRRNVEKLFDVSVEKDFVPLIKNQFALTISEPISKDISTSIMAIVKVRDTDKALFQWSKMRLRPQYDDVIEAENNIIYRTHEIHKSDSSQLLEILFGTNFKSITAPFYTAIKGFIVFSNEISSLKKFIDDFLNEKTLSTDTEFNKFSENLVSESNFLFYINPSRSLSIPEIYCNNEFIKKFTQNIGYYKKFGSLAFQITNNNNSIYNQIIIAYTPNTRIGREYIWNLELSSSLAVKPLVVKNHYDGSNELLIFDDSNNIYLITAQGKILWKKTLKSKIVGEAQMIDLYNNNKFQYLFSTENYLYLIDRKGRDVANYPIRLSSKAITGLKAFDFKNDKNHKYFVGCDNNCVFGYYKSGKPIQGWNPKKLDDNLEHPVKYFKKNGKIFLFGVSKKGTFYMWDSRGKEVFKPIKLQTKISHPFKIKFAKNSYLTSIDTAGISYFIYLNGEVMQKKFIDCSPNVYFDFLDINVDGSKELIFAENNLISAFRPDGETALSIELSNNISSRPKYIFIDNIFYIAYLNDATKQLFLIDTKGRLLSGFPLYCNKPYHFFDLNNDENLELIGGNGNELFMARF